MRIRPGVELASLSDIGCQRENNEDQYAYWEPANDEEFARKGRLAIVADGMGGHEGGQEASRIAVEAIQEVFVDAPNGDLQSLLLRLPQLPSAAASSITRTSAIAVCIWCVVRTFPG